MHVHVQVHIHLQMHVHIHRCFYRTIYLTASSPGVERACTPSGPEAGRASSFPLSLSSFFFFKGCKGRISRGPEAIPQHSVWSLGVFRISVKAASPARRLRSGDSWEHNLAPARLSRSSRSCHTSASWSPLVLQLVTPTVFPGQCFLAVHLHTPGRVLSVLYWSVNSMSCGTASPETKQNRWPKTCFHSRPPWAVADRWRTFEFEFVRHAIPPVATRPQGPSSVFALSVRLSEKEGSKLQRTSRIE